MKIKTDSTHVLALLKRLHACYTAYDWVFTNRSLTPHQLWESCENPHWLIYIASESALIKNESDPVFEEYMTLCLTRISRKIIADIIRQRIPWEHWEALLEGKS